MKAFIIVLLIASTSHAQHVPKHMQDAVITVQTKDGKVYKFSGNTNKVVIRDSESKKAEVKPQVVEKIVVVEKTVKPKLNRVSLFLGYGLTGKQALNSTASEVEVTQQKGVIAGVMYQRTVKDDISVMGGIMTNQTLVIGVGKDY